MNNRLSASPETAGICLDALQIANHWNDCPILGIPSLAAFKGPYPMNCVKNEIRENRLRLIGLLERYRAKEMLEPGELHLLAEEYKKEGVLCLRSDMDPERALALFEKAMEIHEDLIGMGCMPHTDLQPAIEDARLCRMALKALGRTDEADELSDLIRHWRQMQVQACQQFEEELYDQYLQDFLQDNGSLLE